MVWDNSQRWRNNKLCRWWILLLELGTCEQPFDTLDCSWRQVESRWWKKLWKLVNMSHEMIYKTYSFLKMDEQKFHAESHVVAGMKAMPNGKEHECRKVTDVSIVEKFETLVDVLENPQVSLDIKRSDVISKRVRVFENTQFNICTTAPILDSSFLVTRYKCKAWNDKKDTGHDSGFKDNDFRHSHHNR